jgi:hypothetical protein
LQSVLFFITVFLLTRQVPLSQYSYIMNIALLSFIIISIYYSRINFTRNIIIQRLLLLNLIILTFLALYSLYLLNLPNDVIRFYIISVLILISYFLNVSSKLVKYFIYILFLQALVVIGIEIYMMVNFSLHDYLPARSFFQERAWGDVYTFNGYIWKVQIKGNALLPFAFFVSALYFSGKKRYFFSISFFVAIVFAGNFAFILGISLFIFLYIFFIKKWTYNKIIQWFGVFLILLTLFGGQAYDFVEYNIEQKAERSNKIRIDQINVLVKDLISTPYGVLIGQGFGNYVDITTEFRDYSNERYYELQGLYFMNQMGLFYFILFLVTNFLFSIYFLKNKVLLVTYISYILYAFFNPYILDTNHIVVIIVLLSLNKVLNEKNLLNTRSI